MENRIDILNELRALSPVLAEIGNGNVFSVPQGYFENLSESILMGLNEGIDFEKTTDIPENYFDTLADNILAKIRSEEVNAELPATLKGLQRTNVFEVPNGYFDNLSAQVIQQINTKQPAKIISFGSRILKYAAAAVVAGAMALGVYQYSNNNIGQVASVQLDEVIEKGKDMSATQFDQAMENLSPDDIAKYLETNGNEEDIELLASNIDESSLPDQDDYIIDDKTLENYLEETDTQAAN